MAYFPHRTYIRQLLSLRVDGNVPAAQATGFYHESSGDSDRLKAIPSRVAHFKSSNVVEFIGYVLYTYILINNVVMLINNVNNHDIFFYDNKGKLY